MAKRRKKTNKNAAFRRFLVALLIILTLCVIAYVLILLGRGGDRSYVPTEELDDIDVATRAPIVVAATEEPEITEEVTTPEATASPTASQSALAAPEPTIEPTQIPGEMYSKRYTVFSKLPEISKDGSAGISRSYASEPDSYVALILEGWGYVNDPNFDGESCGTFIVLRNKATDSVSAYIAENIEGISGKDHPDTLCKNPSSADWRACIDVSGFSSGEYGLSVVIGFKDQSSGKKVFRRYALTDMQNLTVKNGEVIIPPLPSE